MPSRSINYNIGINADTAQAKANIESLMRDLQKLGTQRNYMQISPDIQQASRAALELGQNLRSALNPETGNLNLEAFNANLKASGRTLADYQALLTSLGPNGQDAFLNLARAIQAADEPLVRTNKLMSDLWTTMRNTVRWQITASALQGFTGALSEAYRYAQDLNESLTNIRIVTEYSTEQMRDFAQYANESAQRLSTTTTDYTDAALIYYQQGLSEEEVQARTETTIRLAQAAGISTREASEELTAIWNNFYDGSQSLEYYADVLVRLGADTASSSEEISEGLQQFASVAETVGLSYEYAASALATITATTRESANTVGTALRTLFARFQGLQLGETLEDGVDLNKYSRALEAVGVQVLDVNGDLREMDDILNDLGSVWDTLSSAQQVALAQTVAGVRQYTRLVALMDNWDFFQENLASAYGAEGSLQVQADIYAESWEAARDRVTAAAENIYDSVINDQLFIDLDNALTPVLNTIADIVDALGGLPGILAVVGSAMTRAFGTKMAQSMRDIAHNINWFRNRNQNSESEQLRDQAAALAGNLAFQRAGLDENSIEYRSLEAQRQVVQLQAQAREEAEKLNDVQREKLQADMRSIRNLQEQVDLYAQSAQNAQDAADAYEEQLRAAMSLDNEDGTLNLNLAKQFKNIFGTTDTDAVNEGLDNLISNFQSAINVQTRYQAARQRFTDNEGQADEAVVKFVNSLKLQTDAQLDSVDAVNEYMSVNGRFTGEMNNANNAVAQYREQLRSLLIASGQFTESNVDSFLTQLVSTYREGSVASQQFANALEYLNQAGNRQRQMFENLIYRQRDWADTVIQLSNTISETMMAIQGIQNIGDVFSNLISGESSAADFTSFLTGITMILPQVSSLFEASNRASIKAAAAYVFSGNAAAAAAGGIRTMSTAIYTLLPVAGLIASVLVGVIIPIIGTFITTSEEAAEAIEEATNAVQEAESELSSLSSELENVRSQIEEIQNLGTLSFTDQEELANLKEQEAILERQLAIQERQLEIAERNRAITARDNVDNAYYELLESRPEQTSTYMPGITGAGEGVNAEDWYRYTTARYTDETPQEQIDEDYQFYQSLLAKEAELRAQYNAEWSDEYNNYENDVMQVIQSMYDGIIQLDEEWITEHLDQLEEERRKFFTEGEIGEFYYSPALNDSSFDGIRQQLYDMLSEGDVEDILNSGLITSEIEQILNEAGISVESFLAWLNNQVDNVYNNVSGLAGATEEDIDSLTDEDWEAAMHLNWDNIDSWEDFITELENYKNNIITVDVRVEGIEEVQELLNMINDAQDPLKSALETYRDQGFLNVNQVQELIADNPEYSALVKALGDGRYALTEDALDVYQNMARAEEQALNQQLQENLSAIYPDSSYLEGYLNTWQEIQGRYHAIIEDFGSTMTGPREVFSNAIEQIQEVTQAYQDNEISAAEYFSQIRESVANNIGSMLFLANTDLDSGIFATVDLTREIFTVLTTQIAAGIEDTKKAFNAGWIDYETYFDGIVEGSSALIDVYQDYYDGLVFAEDGQAGFLKSMDDLTEAEKEAYKQGKITNEMLKDREDLTDEQAAAADRATLAYQDLIEAQSQQPFVDFADQYANLFSDATIDGTLQLDLYADASIANEDEVNAMLDDFGVRISTRLNELYKQEDKTAYNEAIAMLQSYGIQVEATGDHTAAEITQAAANNLAGLSALMTDVQGNTETTLGNLLGNVGTIMSAIGTIISNFDYTITMESEQTKPGEFNLAKWVLSRGTSGIQLPDFQYKITGVAGTEMQTGIDALIAAGQDIAANREDYGSIIGGALGGNIWDQYSQGDNENPAGGNFPFFPEEEELDPNAIPDDFYDDQSGGGGGGGGGGDAQEYDLEEPKALEDIEDRYHEINRQIERQADLLDDIDNATDRAYGARKLAGYEQQIEELNVQLDNYNEKLAEAENHLISDRTELNNLFNGLVSFDEDGEILGYQAIEQQMVDDYNAFLANYNAFIQMFNALSKAEQEARQAEYDSWQAQLEAANDLFQRRQDALAQYEETLDTIQEVRDSIEETQRAIADARLAEIEHRLEVVIDVHEVRDAVQELTKEIAESFGDMLTHGIESTRIGWENAQADMGLLSEYQQTYNEYLQELANADEYTDVEQIISNLQDLQDQVIGTAQDLLSWIEELEEVVPNAIDDARERFDQFLNQLEHNDTIASAIEELYELQGVTIETEEGFNRLQSATQERLDSQVAQAQLNRQWFERARDELAQAEAALVGVAETDPQYDYLRNQRDALLEEYNAAQEAMLESAAAAMEAAQEMYTRALEKALNDFNNLLTDGIGLANLQTQYDHFIDTEERYLDKVNEAYEVASWYNKLQTDIDNATDSAMRDRLEALQEEIDIRRENNTLSEYDLDILEAKYQVLQAQMALEDAQNNRNQLRLVRDSQGNWNYQYTADAEQIAQAEQDLLDAENNWYNIAKDQVTDVTEEILSTWQDCYDDINEVYSDMTLSDEERSRRAQEVYNYYVQKIKDLENEKQVAIKDMNEAGNQSLIDATASTGADISDLVGMTADELKDIVSQAGMDINDLLLADQQQLIDIFGENSQVVNAFDNTYADALNNMTSNTANFEQYLSDLLQQAEDNFNNYRDTVADVADDTGTSLDNLDDYLQQASDSTDNLTDAGMNATDMMWDQIDAIMQLCDQYAQMLDMVYQNIEAQKELANAIANTIQSEANKQPSGSTEEDSGLGYDPNTDYNDLISDAIRQGWISYGSSTYNELFSQREAKIKDLGLTDEYALFSGGDANRYFAGLSQDGGYLAWGNKTLWEKRLHALGISGYESGGYTGEFNNGRLAILHEKELVLNQEDTRNILAAVELVRSFTPDLINSIEKTLDSNIASFIGMLASRMDNSTPVASTHDTIEQTVTIERVEFPNVTSADEINEAFATIVNDAAQWANRKRN